MTRIFIVDDHEVLREGLKRLFFDEAEIDVVGEASTGRQAIKSILHTEVDVVLLDLSLPDLDGLEVLVRLRRHKPKLPILIYTMHGEDHLALRYLKAGASGYITKGSRAQTLISAVRRVADGHKFVTKELSELLFENLSSNVNSPLHSTLSNREFTVFRLIACGKSISEISEELRLSGPTISTYRKRVLDKMKMKNNAEISIYAIKNKLID